MIARHPLRECKVLAARPRRERAACLAAAIVKDVGVLGIERLETAVVQSAQIALARQLDEGERRRRGRAQRQVLDADPHKGVKGIGREPIDSGDDVPLAGIERRPGLQHSALSLRSAVGEGPLGKVGCARTPSITRSGIVRAWILGPLLAFGRDRSIDRSGCYLSLALRRCRCAGLRKLGRCSSSLRRRWREA